MHFFSKYRIVVLLLLGVLYVGLTQRYRAYDVDNPWFLSFSYNYCHDNIQSDTFMQVHYPAGMDGVHLFGKIPATAQCVVMNRIGWSPASVVYLNVALGLAALWLWSEFLRKLGYRDRWIVAFLVLLGVGESFVSMMEKARYESFAFLLLSLSLWLGVYAWEIPAALIGMLAVEVEPAAIVVPVVVIVLLALRTHNRKRLTLKLLGCAAASVALYVALHPGAAHEIATAKYPHTGMTFGPTLHSYFLERRRHLPELVMLALGAALYWIHRKKTGRPAWIGVPLPVSLAVAAIAVLSLLKHPNPAYEVMATPFLLWLALEGYERAPRWQWVPYVVFAGIMLQYLYLFHRNEQEGFDRKDIAAVRRQIASSQTLLGLADSQLHLCGDYSVWFAHPEHYSACTSNQPAAINAANLFLCFDGPLMPEGLSAVSPSCAETAAIRPLREISSITVRRHRLHFEVPR